MNGQVVRQYQDHIRTRSESPESSDCEPLSEELDSMPVPFEVGPEEYIVYPLLQLQQ